jgi:hypothetical protein
VARRALERGSRWPAMAGHGGGGRQSVRCLVRRGKRWGGGGIGGAWPVWAG